MQGSQTHIYDFLRARLKKIRDSCSFVIQCYKFHLYFMYTPTSLKAESVQFCHHHCQVKKNFKKKEFFRRYFIHTSSTQYFPPFFFFNTSSASGSYPGAMIPSETYRKDHKSTYTHTNP